MGVSAFRKKFLIKDSMYEAKNGISLCVAHKMASIVLILNEYYQFRVWCKFVSMNFNREEHIGSTVEDTEVWYFEFVPQKDLLRCSLLEISNRYMIIYMSYNCYCEFLPGVWQTCFKSHWLYLFKQSVVQLFSITILLVYIWNTSLINNPFTLLGRIIIPMVHILSHYQYTASW